jgi:hypothetical protein
METSKLFVDRDIYTGVVTISRKIDMGPKVSVWIYANELDGFIKNINSFKPSPIIEVD